MNKKISKEIIIVFVLCLGFAFGFFVNQKINEKIYADVYSENGLNLSILAEAWRNIKEGFVFEENIDSEAMVYDAVKGLVSSLGDPYTSFLTPEEAESFQDDLDGKFDGIGIQIAKKDDDIIVISPIKNTPAEKAGIVSGDIIKKINDEEISSLALDAIVQKIRGTAGTNVLLTVERNEIEKIFDIKRDTIIVPSAELEFIETEKGKIALLSIFQFSETSSKDVKELTNKILNTSNVNGIILDLRNNPGGLVSEAKNIASLFLEKDLLVLKQCDKEEECFWLKSDGPGKLADYKIVVLINKGTASAAEILTGALDGNLENVTTLGETSFGKGLVQKVLYLSDGSILKMTTEKWYTPLDEQIHGIGIEPEIKIENTEENDDSQFKKALELIDNK